MKISEIATPVLAVERSAFERNLGAMDALLAKLPMTLYPHYKSNKCLEIAKMQLARGAGGITCAKVSEAEDLADGGVKSIVVANQVVQPEKVARLAALARRADVTVCVDDAGNVAGLKASRRDGSTLTVLAKSVVLATGGYGADYLRVAQLDGHTMASGAASGDTGDADSPGNGPDPRRPARADQVRRGL